MDDQALYMRNTRVLSEAHARFHAATPPDCQDDELHTALDAAIDELTALRSQLRTRARARNQVARDAKEVGDWLKEVTV